ncbi:UNVERIFIED_CONTAM: hypothetical protein H355_011137 [Colinus virginianus]|nr:hypothetical protein H355_011137 [Colinus virginianus]
MPKAEEPEKAVHTSLHICPQQHSSVGLPTLPDFDSAWKKQPCLGSLPVEAMEEGVEGATALALPLVVALEEVEAAEAGSATAHIPHRGEVEVVDSVVASAAGVFITWVAAEGLLPVGVTGLEALEAEWVAMVEE